MTSFGNPMSACGLQDPSQSSNYASFMTNAAPRSVYEPLGLASPNAYLAANHSAHHHHHHHHHHQAAAAAAAAAVAHNQRSNTTCQLGGYATNMLHQQPQHQPPHQQGLHQQHQQQQQQQQQQANLNVSNGI
jgi:hypothetical protein